MHKRTLLSVLAAGIFCAGTLSLAAAKADAADIARGVILGGARDLGRLPDNTPVRLTIGLKLRNATELDDLIAAQSMKSSPLYRHFLRPAQVRDAFGASPADYARVAGALGRAGFSIVRNDPLRTAISVVAPARTVEAYFSTRLDALALPGRRPMHVNLTAATIPAAVAGVVASVTGLDEQSLYTTPAAVTYGTSPHATPAPSAPPSPTPTGTPLYGPDLGYGPQAVSIAFDFPSKRGYTGTGVTVADVIDGVILDNTDIKTFLDGFGLKRTGPKTAQIDVDGGCSTGVFGCSDSYSATIDAEGIIGTAPGVNYQIYDVPFLSNTNIEDGLRAVVDADSADVVNIAFAGCELFLGEASLVQDSIYKLGVVQGITFESVAFGGGNPCGSVGGFSVQAPADSPHGVAVGGADSFVASDGSRTHAPIVNEDTGAGVSVLFPKPKFQDGLAAAGAGRSLPDIAGPAAINSVGPSVYYLSFGGWIGGFPFIDNAPVAGALAEIAQAQGSRLGNYAPDLYALHATDGKTHFYDVTLGCNGAGGVEPYCAGRGYDIVSGLGVPNFLTLIGK